MMKEFSRKSKKNLRLIEKVELRLLSRAWKFRCCGEKVESFFWISYSSNTKQDFDESRFDGSWESPMITFVHLCSHIDADRWKQISHCVDQGTLYDRWLDSKLSTDNFIDNKRKLKINFFLTGDIKFIQLVKGLQSVTSVFFMIFASEAQYN